MSNLNSLATVTYEDFLSQSPAFSNLKDRHQLVMIKIVGAIYGVIIMGVSFGVGLLSGVIESSMLMTSATSGPLLGVFLLAMLVPCANKKVIRKNYLKSEKLSTNRFKTNYYDVFLMLHSQQNLNISNLMCKEMII